MIPRNLRHLRVFVTIAEQKSLTAAANMWRMSQPAATQAIAKLERHGGGPLFERRPQGLFLTSRGNLLLGRVRRSLGFLDPVLSDISPRLKSTLTYAQLQALVSVGESENFTLAARRMGLAQPTVHRAITRIEQDADRGLFERTTFGILPTRLCQSLITAARLAVYELDQADAELAELNGGEMGRVVIGAMPLSRSTLLPRALSAFRKHHPTYPVLIHDGPYDELLGGLRRGAIDVLVGALRDPAPIGDIVQQHLFDDGLALLAGPDHPLVNRGQISVQDLLAYPWIVPRRMTPTRDQFEALFLSHNVPPPASIIESGSLLLMRELLTDGNHLGCISRHQSERECQHGLMVSLDYPTGHLRRPIGLTFRQNWQPTPQQHLMLRLLCDQSPERQGE